MPTARQALQTRQSVSCSAPSTICNPVSNPILQLWKLRLKAEVTLPRIKSWPRGWDADMKPGPSDVSLAAHQHLLLGRGAKRLG